MQDENCISQPFLHFVFFPTIWQLPGTRGRQVGLGGHLQDCSDKFPKRILPSVKLSTGNQELQTRSIMTLPGLNSDKWSFFFICKTSPITWKKRFKKPVMSSQCKVYGPSGNLWAGSTVETLLRIFNLLHNQEVNMEAKELICHMCCLST